MKPNWKRLATVAWFAFAIFWWAYVLYVATHQGFDWSLLVIIGILPPFYIAGIWKTGAWIIKRFKEDKPPKLD